MRGGPRGHAACDLAAVDNHDGNATLSQFIGRRKARTANEWQGRVYSRLSVLPEQAEPLQRAQLLAALSVGTEIIRLRRVAHRFDQDVELDAALDALAKGNSSAAAERLALLDQGLAVLSGRGAPVRLRARASILAISEALSQHAAYFNSEAAR